MSSNYADGLSAYEDKGILGTPETFDSHETLNEKCSVLYNMIINAKHVVVHTGAGISTSAGIPDFRGPSGVWTLEKKGLKPDMNVSFSEAKPTLTHMALLKLVKMGIVKYIVSQNIDGLHLKSGIERQYLAELHGNMFLEKCSACQRQFIRGEPVQTVGQKSLEIRCKAVRPSGSATCRGTLHDVVLDWEHNLPEDDLKMSDMHSSIADLSICFGTTLQIIPSGTLPTYTLKNGGKLVIINLQPTKHNKKAHLVINYYVDDVIKILMDKLNFDIPPYTDSCNFTKSASGQEWSNPPRIMKELKLMYKRNLADRKLRKQPQKRKPFTQSKHIKKKEKVEDLAKDDIISVGKIIDVENLKSDGDDNKVTIVGNGNSHNEVLSGNMHIDTDDKVVDVKNLKSDTDDVKPELPSTNGNEMIDSQNVDEPQTFTQNNGVNEILANKNDNSHNSVIKDEIGSDKAVSNHTEANINKIIAHIDSKSTNE